MEVDERRNDSLYAVECEEYSSIPLCYWPFHCFLGGSGERKCFWSAVGGDGSTTSQFPEAKKRRRKEKGSRNLVLAYAVYTFEEQRVSRSCVEASAVMSRRDYTGGER